MNSKLASVFMLVVGPLAAEPPATGFIRLVNAVAHGTGTVKLEIDGEDMCADGYRLGDATGGIGLAAGSHRVSIKKDGVNAGATTVMLDKDSTITLIPYAEEKPATERKPRHFAVKILRLKQKLDDTGRTASWVSVSARPEVKVELEGEDGKWATGFVKRLSTCEMPLRYSQGYAPAKVDGISIKSIPIGSAGTYVVVLYDDMAGKVQSCYFRDFKFTHVAP